MRIAAGDGFRSTAKSSAELNPPGVGVDTLGGYCCRRGFPDRTHTRSVVVGYSRRPDTFRGMPSESIPLWVAVKNRFYN